jgi:hypothetical protein
LHKERRIVGVLLKHDRAGKSRVEPIWELRAAKGRPSPNSALRRLFFFATIRPDNSTFEGAVNECRTPS